MLREKQKRNKETSGHEYYTENTFVCCTDDGYPINPDHLTNYMSRLSKDLGVKIKFYDSRHTHATIKVLQERLGHKDLNTYSHVTKKLEDEVILKGSRNFLNSFATKIFVMVANSVANSDL